MNERRETVSVDEDLLERIAYISGELDEIVDITKGVKKEEGEPHLRLPVTLHSIFKYLVLKNVTKGRMALSVYFSGKEIGFASQVKTKESLIKLVRRLDLGILTIKEPSDENIVLELQESLSSRDIKEAKMNICYFEAGFFSGALENITGRKVDFKEIQCRATSSNPHCTFELIQPGEQFKIEGVTIPIMSLKGYSPENVKLLTSLASHTIAAIENALVFETTRKQALVDGLTDTYNHRFFQQTIRIEIKRASRHNMPLSLLMCDINKFKDYNDRFGHSVGDEVLKKIARILVMNIRDIDFVSRYGGDEFAVILPQTDSAGARVVAQRIIGKVTDCRFPHENSTDQLSVSLGIASIEGKTEVDAQVLIDKADKALLEAKQSRQQIGQAT